MRAKARSVIAGLASGLAGIVIGLVGLAQEGAAQIACIVVAVALVLVGAWLGASRKERASGSAFLTGSKHENITLRNNFSSATDFVQGDVASGTFQDNVHRPDKDD